jgi:hypothetical protein
VEDFRPFENAVVRRVAVRWIAGLGAWISSFLSLFSSAPKEQAQKNDLASDNNNRVTQDEICAVLERRLVK